MHSRKPSPVLGLLSCSVLFAASAASAENTPLPLSIVYPAYLEPNLPSNPFFIAHALGSAHIDPANIRVHDTFGHDFPITVTPDADAQGAVVVKPDVPLPQGSYTLETGLEPRTLSVSGQADTVAPSAIVGPIVSEERDSKKHVQDISIAFPRLIDDTAQNGLLTYDIWASQAPAEPDLDGKPNAMAAAGYLQSDGLLHVSLAPGADCLGVLPSTHPGSFIVRLRARDSAGNLGPASDPIPVQVTEMPQCPPPSSNGCAAVPALAPAAWVAVALWLRRRPSSAAQYRS